MANISHRWGVVLESRKALIFDRKSDFQKCWNANCDHFVHCVKSFKLIALVSIDEKRVRISVESTTRSRKKAKQKEGRTEHPSLNNRVSTSLYSTDIINSDKVKTLWRPSLSHFVLQKLRLLPHTRWSAKHWQTAESLHVIQGVSSNQ